MILYNPQIVIFDEATSSLDSVTETKILNNMNEIFKDKTLIVISHKPVLQIDFDEKIILSEGLFMKIIIETERLLIRGIEEKDAPIFANMARDGSLTEIGFEEDCYKWIDDWAIEAKEFTSSYYENLEETGIVYFIEHYNISKLIATISVA